MADLEALVSAYVYLASFQLYKETVPPEVIEANLQRQAQEHAEAQAAARLSRPPAATVLSGVRKRKANRNPAFVYEDAAAGSADAAAAAGAAEDSVDAGVMSPLQTAQLFSQGASEDCRLLHVTMLPRPQSP